MTILNYFAIITFRFDYLQIYADKNIGKFCGLLGPSLNFTSNSVTLQFKSDNRITYKGFQLRYIIIGKYYTSFFLLF